MRPALLTGALFAALSIPVQPAFAEEGALGLAHAALADATSYRLPGNDRVVVIDFPSLHEQGRMFGRVVLFAERHGAPKTRVMTQDEVRQWLKQHAQRIETLTVGNNFRASQLARFFNMARLQEEPLNGDEQQLRDWLLQTGLLRQSDDGLSVAVPEAVIVTLPQASSVPGCGACTVTAAQREVILEHELSHAHFATDARYRDYVMSFWADMTKRDAGSKFTQFLHKRGYNADDRELLADEMQAFLVHTPNTKMFAAAALGMTDEELDEIRRRFREGWETLQSADRRQDGGP